jgi:hypothetical protein
MSIGAGALAHQLAALRVKTLRASMRTRRMLVDILPGYFERLLFATPFDSKGAPIGLNRLDRQPALPTGG